MLRLFYRASALVIYALLALATRVHAIPIALTDRAALDGALGALTSVSVATETLDSTAAGKRIGDGGVVSGFTLTYPTLAGFGVTLQIITAGVTLPNDCLGSDDGGGVLQGGDELVISVSPLHAFGLYRVVDAGLGASDDGDLTLSGDGTKASLLSGAQQSFAQDNNLEVHFLELVRGGQANTASGSVSSVSGGFTNTANGAGSSISGGQFNFAAGLTSAVAGGNSNSAIGEDASVSGGMANRARGLASVVGGGAGREVANQFDWRAGSGLFQED